MRNKGLLFMAGIIAFFLQPSCHSQTIAFPGAIGFGSYATGGRNGSVYHVTTLADSGAGSFRDAVSSGNRTIVFDVGGIVNLSSAISCSSGLTIAGQTAPGGIVFNGGEISFANRNNIICRYIRIRPGSSTTSSTDDALSFYRASNVIVDHTSIAFAPWNNIDGVGDSTHVVTSITVQNSINANPTGQQFGAHTESVGGQWSWFYNIFANSHNRNPLAKINTVYINNVDYNCSAGYTTHTSTRFKHDIVNNYFVAGPAYSTSSDFPWFQVDNNQSIYYSSNYFDSNENGSLDGGITTPYWYQGGTGTILSSPWSSWTTVVPVASAALAWRFDVSAAGAFPRDEVDALLINQVKTMGSGSVGTTAGTAGPGSGLYTSQSQTGLGNNGYGTITGGVAPANFSGDGIADYWKLATGLNTNTSYPLTNTATGYTLLENYLNFLAAPHAVTQTNTPVDVNLSQLSGGFTSGATFSVTNATNGTITLLNGTNAHFVPAGNFSGTGSFSYSVSESGNAISATVTVCITPVVPPAAAASFNGALVVIAASTAATSTSPPSNLTWRGDGIANVWSTAVSNWLNGANVASFKNGDVCTYDDTGSRTPAINLTSALSPGAIFFNHSLNYTLSGSGAISGSGPFSKSGSGTLTIATTNTGFSGSINVAGGSLSLNTGTSMGSGAVTINDGATLSLASGSSAINIPGSITVPVGAVATINSGYVANGGYGNFISGDSTSVLNLVGNQSLGGANTNQFNSFKGTINISSGSIRFSTASSGNTFGSLNPNFIINGTFQPRNAGNTVVLGALNGSGQLAGPQTAGTGSGSTVYIIGGKNQDAVFTGSIVSNANSAGSLICFNKVGSGIQSLMGSNTFGGTNGVLAGTLLVNGSTMPSLTTVFSNATLGGSGIINGSVSVNSGGILSPGSTSPGILTINGNLTNNSPILNFRLSGSPAGTNDGINMTGNLEMNGAQSYNFILTDTALGAGTYSLIEGANNSTTTGVTFSNNLPANTRQNISMISAVPGSNPSYVRLAVTGSAASLVWRGTNGVNWDAGSINWINGSSPDAYYNLDSVVFDDSGYNPSSVTLASVVTPASMIVNSTQNYVFSGSGSLSGQGGLTKLGTSTLTISTSNTNYTGTMNLFGGTLAATTGGALGNGALTISNGSTLSLTANGTIFFGGSVTIPSNTSGNIYSGTLANGISGNLYSGNSNSVLYISNGVSFSGTNTGQFDGFTGILNILPGATLRYSANFSGKTFGSLSPYMVINGTLQPRNAGNTIQLGALTGSGVIAGPHAASGTGDTLYVIGGNNSDSTFTGVISSNSMVVGSDVILNKTGTGRLTLSGNNTYAGGTTVSAGTLRVNNTVGSGTGSGPVEIFSGAILTGKGIITGAVTVDDGATFAPGDALGTMFLTNNLTLNDNSILNFYLGTNSSSAVVGGNLVLTGQLNVTNSPGFGVGAYTLFTYGGALTFGNLVLASSLAGYVYSFNTNTPGSVKLIAAPLTPPHFSAMNLSGTNLMLTVGNGKPLGNLVVLTSTNLFAPLTGWSRIATNQFDSLGNFQYTATVDSNSGQRFYSIQVQ